MISPIRPSAVEKPNPKSSVQDDQVGVARSVGSATPIPVWKKTLFAVFTVLICFGGVECLLTLAGVRAVRYAEDPCVGFSSYVPLFTEQASGDGKQVLVTAQNKRAFFNRQQFPKEKTAAAYRIFCVGGSTTYGRPYDDRTSFCGWLRELLADAAPDRQWEVINAGGISYASYRVAVVMEELIRYSPDLFIIYSGHNEFLERRTYANILDTPAAVRSLSALLSHSRTYSAIHQALHGPARRNAAETENLLPAEVDALLDRSIGPADYTRDQLQTSAVIAPLSLEPRPYDRHGPQRGGPSHSGHASIQPAGLPRRSKANTAKVSVPRGVSQWNALFEAARSALESGDDVLALSKCDAAMEIDDQHAHAHFLRGQVLMKLERYAEARSAFVRARKEDVCPLRAFSAIRDIVIETAQSHDVRCVDFVSLVEAESAHRLPGAELFLDHVHPTIEGNRLLALALLDTIADMGRLSYAPTWNRQAAERVTDRVLESLDNQSHAIALRNLAKVLGWAGKSEESARLARQAMEIDPRDAESQYIVGLQLAGQQRDEDALLRFEKCPAAEARLCEGSLRRGASARAHGTDRAGHRSLPAGAAHQARLRGGSHRLGQRPAEYRGALRRRLSIIGRRYRLCPTMGQATTISALHYRTGSAGTRRSRTTNAPCKRIPTTLMFITIWALRSQQSSAGTKRSPTIRAPCESTR